MSELYGLAGLSFAVFALSLALTTVLFAAVPLVLLLAVLYPVLWLIKRVFK